MLIKSRVKYIQSLGQKKFRDDENIFVAEGPKIINELLNAQNVTLVSLFALKDWLEGNAKLHSNIEKGEIVEISERELKRISFLTTPHQVLALFKKPSFPAMKLNGKVSLALDAIRDPGNLGTLVRIADWFGVRNLICSPDCADVYNPKTTQATMGSITRVPVYYRDIKKIIGEHPNLPVYGTLLRGRSIREIGCLEEGLILVGNESRGLSEELEKLVQFPVTIPGRGGAESLNAAVAAGIVLSHLIKII
jgi:TrmH family RNA methyltransferase